MEIYAPGTAFSKSFFLPSRTGKYFPVFNSSFHLAGPSRKVLRYISGKLISDVRALSGEVNEGRLPTSGMPAGRQSRIWQCPQRRLVCNPRTTRTFHHTLQSTYYNCITASLRGSWYRGITQWQGTQRHVWILIPSDVPG